MYQERKAKIKYHETAFLNPHAMFLRDLSVAFVSGFAKRDTRILDPTAATGIRGIRLYLETRAKDVTILDINKSAAAMARKNVRFNKVKAKVLNKSIQEFANTTKERFDVIDLDPFGSAAPYIYDLMKVSKDGTYLLATATDTAVLCGAHEKACVKAYDAKPLHNELCHEVGIRILLGYIARVAAQFNMGIEVVMSLSYLHYMKVFVRLEHGAEKSTESVRNLGYAYYCSNCGSRGIEKGMFPKRQKCDNCGHILMTAGKLWAANIQDKKSIRLMLDYFIKNKMSKDEIRILEMMYDEIDSPLYYSIPKTTRKMHIPSVSPLLVIEKLRKNGFSASRTHFDNSSVKTDALIGDVKAVLDNAKK
jgi:tRNA (guanine26-N2/guanine27-N2)-dimethyltransferase